MATMSSFLKVFCVTLLLLHATAQQDQEDSNTSFQRRLDQAQSVMSDKGYREMASMLHSIQSDLETLNSQNKTYTIFAPDDASFWARSNSDPPVSLVRYHTIPDKVDRDLLESPATLQQKIETLLQGHPLIITTGLPESYTQSASLNLVMIATWDVYNDGHLIVHGLRQFFDPYFQTTYYPWFNQPEAPTISPTFPPQSTFSPPATTSSGDKYYGIHSLMVSCVLCIFLLLF